jgi:Glycoside hydrolase 123 N-terminal domain
MKKHQKLSLLVLAGALATISCSCDVKKISEVAKPVDKTAIKRALPQDQVPKSWKEAPFVERTPAPEFTKIEQKRGFIIFSRAISDIVYPNTLPKNYERVNSLSAFACRKEFEPMTFTIYPDRELKNLKIRVSALKQGANTIPNSNISVKLQSYWKIPYPSYRTKGTWRRSPELLEKVSVHSSPAKECQRYWVTVKVPAKAKAGIYTGAVTLWDDSYDKATRIPITFRVMPFELQKDPNKNFTAYYYDVLWQHDLNKKTKKENDFILKAGTNNYKSMLDHGFNAMPTVYLYYNRKKDEIYARKGDIIMKAARKAGFKNIPFVPVCAGNAISEIIRKYDKKFKRGSHWKYAKDHKLAPNAVKKITELFAAFNKKWLNKGYPQMYCCPLDEVSPSVWEFASKIYTAVKKSGINVYITKNPTATDARHYKKTVDAFCTQPFTPDYKEVTNSKRLQYWCYPNHNAWEVRIPSVMCNGGRMTYGFGLWRSGFSTLIPWAWSCWRSKTPTSYIDNKRFRTPGGNPIDKDGEVINTTYWECFREGYDDGRYIYTLQKAIVEHEKNTDKKCVELCKAGRDLLQKIWNSITPELKYKGPATVSILPQDFTKLRWQMAVIIEKLAKYKGQKINSIPSVIIDTTQSAKTKDVIKEAAKADQLIIKDLGSENFDRWKTVTKEITLTTTDKKAYSGKKSLKMAVKIDYKTDGGGEKGKYVIGWPRIYTRFPKNKLDLTKYDFLTFKVLIDSDRNEVADDYTPAYWTISSHIKGLKVPDLRILGQVPQRKWLTVTLDLNKIIDKNSILKPWKSIKIMQFGISENKYADKTQLTFYLDDISLISFKTPILKDIKSTSTVLLPARKLNCEIQLMGEGSAILDNFKICLSLLDGKGKSITKTQSLLSNCANMELNIENIPYGKYIINAEIINKKGEVVSKIAKKISFMKGPTS